MFRVINGCKRVLKIGNTIINYKKYADFDDSYSYELVELNQLIKSGDVKVIYNLVPKKTIGHKLEKKQFPNPELEITEKDPKPKIEEPVEKIEEVVEETEIIEEKSKSRKKKKISEDKENNEND